MRSTWRAPVGGCSRQGKDRVRSGLRPRGSGVVNPAVSLMSEMGEGVEELPKAYAESEICQVSGR